MGLPSPTQCESPMLQDDTSPAVTRAQQAAENQRQERQRTTPAQSRGCRCMHGQGMHQ